MFITRDSYGRAMANLALDVLRSNVECELNNKANMLEAIEVIESYVANSKLADVKEVKGSRDYQGGVAGKIIVERMKGNALLKPYAKRFAHLEKVTTDDLEHCLPDYISGGLIRKLMKPASTSIHYFDDEAWKNADK